MHFLTIKLQICANGVKMITVASAYNLPGSKPTAASVPLRNSPNFSDIICIQNYTFLVPPVVNTNRLQSSEIAPPQTHKKSVCKPTAENHLLKLVHRLWRAAAEHILLVVNVSYGDTRIVFGMHYIIKHFLM